MWAESEVVEKASALLLELLSESPLLLPLESV
jgi:hypothetical protein